MNELLDIYKKIVSKLCDRYTGNYLEELCRKILGVERYQIFKLAENLNCEYFDFSKFEEFLLLFLENVTDLEKVDKHQFVYLVERVLYLRSRLNQHLMHDCYTEMDSIKILNETDKRLRSSIKKVGGSDEEMDREKLDHLNLLKLQDSIDKFKRELLHEPCGIYNFNLKNGGDSEKSYYSGVQKLFAIELSLTLKQLFDCFTYKRGTILEMSDERRVELNSLDLRNVVLCDLLRLGIKESSINSLLNFKKKQDKSIRVELSYLKYELEREKVRNPHMKLWLSDNNISLQNWSEYEFVFKNFSKKIANIKNREVIEES